MKSHVLLAIGALTAVTAASAQTPVPVRAFDALELRGGGTVTLRHGAEHRVTLIRGDLATSRIEVDREGDLVIEACRRTCRDYRLEVEVVSPNLDTLAIEGGGTIRAMAGSPTRGQLTLAIAGGGTIDLTAVPTRDITAAVQGGGAIRVHATRSLTASVQGGGSVRYAGNPVVTSSINGGGSVSPIR